MTPTSEILNKAADLIEERGWVQGTGWGRDTAALCLEGGIAAAAGIVRTLGNGFIYQGCPAYDAVCSYLNRHPRPRQYPVLDSLWDWNDTPGRTAEEVIEVLRAAALIEQARETATEPVKVPA